MRVRWLLLAALMSPAGGCVESAPENPTWIDDVRPILAANCVRCHSVPQTGGAQIVAYFRLDTYDNFDPALDAPDGFVGAAQQSLLIKTRAGPGGDMPLDEDITETQRETLARWADNAVAAMPALGERPGNGEPELIAIDDLPGQAGGEVNLAYEIADPERDLVTGAIVLRAANGDETLATAALHDGRDVATFDTGTLSEGDYEILIRLTDDLADVEESIGTLTVTSAFKPVGAPKQ